MKATRTCSVDGCGDPFKSRGWCNAHYLKWSKYGDPLAVGRVRRRCTVDDCAELVKGRGYCNKHWLKWRKYGNPTAVGTVGKPRAADPGYLAAHKRVYRARGVATEHPCLHCGEPAAEWAYNHAAPDPDERIGVTRGTASVRYSLNPAFYVPLCRPCHGRFDAPARAERGEPDASRV